MFYSYSLILTTIFGLLSLSVVNGEFPDDPKPCKYGDAECIKLLINFFLQEKSHGDASINLREVQPLPVKQARLEQGEESPVNIDLVLTDSLIYGLETAKAVKVKGFGQDLTKKHQVILNIETLSLVGDYEINGKILILPIKGNGKSNITMVNPDIVMTFVGSPVEKDGATYMTIDKMKLDAIPKRMIYKVDNLFNGDKALSDNMNLFLNENWLDIYNEVRISLGNAFADIYKDVINEVFTKYPYEQFFSE